MDIKNKEVENIQYYDSYLGYESIYNKSTSYLNQILKVFIKERKKRVKELHNLTYVSKRPKCLYESMDNISIGGLANRFKGYINDPGPYRYGVDETRPDVIMLSLACINEDYLNNKIHVLEVELCYLNKNIKAIKHVIRTRKSK